MRLTPGVFVTAKAFQSSLVFASKAKSLPGRGPLAHSFNRKYYTWLERVARDKTPSLIETLVHYGCKKFYNNDPRRFAFWHSLGVHYYHISLLGGPVV